MLYIKKVTHFSTIRFYQRQSYGLGASDAAALRAADSWDAAKFAF